MTKRVQDPQDHAIKVLVGLIKSHQGLLGLAKAYRGEAFDTNNPINLRAADEAIEAAGRLLNDLRLGEVKMVRWVPTTLLWCGECGNQWDGQSEDCLECGGQCSDA